MVTFFGTVSADLRGSHRAVRSTVTGLFTETAGTGELTLYSRVGALGLGMTLLAAVKAWTGLGRFRTVCLAVSEKVLAKRSER